MEKFYCYVYLDPRKPGKFIYRDFVTFFYEPFYVGKGSDNKYEKRLYEHLNNDKYSKSNKFRYNKIQKIKNENINQKEYIIKLINNINEKCSFCFEKYLIELIGRYDKNEGPLTNLTNGGDGSSGYKPTKEDIEKAQKNKRKNAEKRGYWFTEETNRKRAQSLLGKPSAMKGKKQTKEHAEKIRIANTGKKRNKEQLQNIINANRNPDKLNNFLKSGENTRFKKGMSPWNKGKINTMSQEGINNIIESNKNRICQPRTLESRLKTSESNKGKKRTEESKKKMSEAAKLVWKRRKENGSTTTLPLLHDGPTL